jgi:hypothetical protein
MPFSSARSRSFFHEREIAREVVSRKARPVRPKAALSQSPMKRSVVR